MQILSERACTSQKSTKTHDIITQPKKSAQVQNVPADICQ